MVFVSCFPHEKHVCFPFFSMKNQSFGCVVQTVLGKWHEFFHITQLWGYVISNGYELFKRSKSQKPIETWYIFIHLPSPVLFDCKHAGEPKKHCKINPNKAWPSGFPYPNRTLIPTIPSIAKQPRIGVSPVPPWSPCSQFGPYWNTHSLYIYILNGNNNNNNNLKWHLPRLWLS